MCYVAPLRAAVLRLGDGGRFSVDQLQSSAHVTTHRARAYVTMLTKAEVLRAANDLFMQGSKWSQWSQLEVRTRPGGNSRRYQAAKARVDPRPIVGQVIGLAIRALRGARSRKSVARRIGITPTYLQRIEDNQRHPSPKMERRILRALNGQ